VLVVEDEAPSQQQVLRRVARDRQLGERDDVGVGVPGALAVLDDLSGVSLEVTDRRIDLGERDS